MRGINTSVKVTGACWVPCRFDLTTRDSYFRILFEVFMNHILENTNAIEWTEQTIMVLEHTSVKLFSTCHLFKNTFVDDIQYHAFIYQTKV